MDMVKDALYVHETLSDIDGLQALQRMMDGDERDEYERRGDQLAAAGGFMLQLEPPTNLSVQQSCLRSAAMRTVTFAMIRTSPTRRR